MKVEHVVHALFESEREYPERAITSLQRHRLIEETIDLLSIEQREPWQRRVGIENLMRLVAWRTMDDEGVGMVTRAVVALEKEKYRLMAAGKDGVTLTLEEKKAVMSEDRERTVNIFRLVPERVKIWERANELMDVGQVATKWMYVNALEIAELDGNGLRPTGCAAGATVREWIKGIVDSTLTRMDGKRWMKRRDREEYLLDNLVWGRIGMVAKMWEDEKTTMLLGWNLQRCVDRRGEYRIEMEIPSNRIIYGPRGQQLVLGRIEREWVKKVVGVEEWVTGERARVRKGMSELCGAS